MAEIEVPVIRISEIEEIPGADKIEVAVAFDYRSIVMKGMFKPGDLAVYLPEGACLPDWLMVKLGLVGRLGSKNRIRAIRLLGVLSQGILYQVTNGQIETCTGPVDVSEGDDVSNLLGVEKVEERPTAKKFYGHCVYLSDMPIGYNINNLKRYPGLLQFDEDVVVTEKMHGTLCGIGYRPGMNRDDLWGDFFTFSKGLGAQGQVFRNSVENEGNVYVKNLVTWLGTTDISFFKSIAGGREMYIYGEIFGRGIQDLTYGTEAPVFRVFDILVQTGRGMSFLQWDNMVTVCELLGMPYVNLVYRGRFCRATMDTLCTGPSTYPGSMNIREGVVVKRASEAIDLRYGRAILKHINPDYLLRKGGTEFN